MKFGPIPVFDAEGAVAAHSIRYPSGVIKKGTRLSSDHIARLAAAGVDAVVAARLDPSDVEENTAALRIAEAIAGANVRVEAPFTGRSNLFAETAGLLTINRAAVDRLNRLDPGITLATLPEFAPVEAGRMVATVKIIPYAVPGSAVHAAARPVGAATLAVVPWRRARVALAATILPGLKPSVMDKTRRVLEERLRPTGATIVEEHRVAHDAAELAQVLATAATRSDLVVAFGASAVADRSDVIPASLEAAGGEIIHFGMPVDPGNLLLLGRLRDAWVLGAPGCARSPVENGFDWILNRLLAGIPVGPEDITGMGVGGLLMEVVSRPQPRDPSTKQAGRVAALVLAAGQSRRMGGPNKLLATFEGVPLVRRSVEAVLQAGLAPVVVVTGHMAEEIRAALDGLDVVLAHNPDYADGLSTSIKTGLAMLPADAAGALIMLADMPGLLVQDFESLVQAFAGGAGPAIVLPTVSGKRGNPVLWSRHFFPELAAVSGDTGGRHLLGRHADAVRTVELGAAAGLDVDTPEALTAAGGVLPTGR